jgi:hypothetical protein
MLVFMPDFAQPTVARTLPVFPSNVCSCVGPIVLIGASL